VRKIRAGRSILLAFGAALVLSLFAVNVMVAEGDSMMPTIKPGDVLLVCKIAYGIRPGSGAYLYRWGAPTVGDIVVFYTPQGAIAVKRCVEIAEGMFFALGDNAAHSYDSHHYGPVPNDNIIGKVLGVR
jgi:signal peptidase I